MIIYILLILFGLLDGSCNDVEADEDKDDTANKVSPLSKVNDFPENILFCLID